MDILLCTSAVSSLFHLCNDDCWPRTLGQVAGKGSGLELWVLELAGPGFRSWPSHSLAWGAAWCPWAAVSLN